MNTAEYTNEPSLQHNTEKKPGAWRLLACKCPRCRRGNMFATANPWRLKTTMKMNETCPECGQPFNIEVGFYYGASYVAYALCVALSVASIIAWWLLIGFSYSDMVILHWIVANTIFLVLLQPYLMRVSRTGWLAFFVRYDAHWRTNPPAQTERTNKTHENNW